MYMRSCMFNVVKRIYYDFELFYYRETIAPFMCFPTSENKPKLIFQVIVASNNCH